MRKLASIQKIAAIKPIEGKDKIAVAYMRSNAWRVVVRKNDFSVGDLCVYIEIDSQLPEREEFEFMRKYGFKVKTVQIGGVLSQGLCLPIKILPEGLEYKEGLDVTKLLDITHVDDSPEEDTMTAKKKNSFIRNLLFRFKLTRKLAKKLYAKKLSEKFPDYLSKTDETRIQEIPEALEDKENLYDVTEKIDGTSATYYLIKNRKSRFNPRYEFGVCSRNKRLPEYDGSPWWKVAKQNNIKDCMLKIFERQYPNSEWICIQGEIVGPGIQGNKYHKKNYELYVFNIIISGMQKDGTVKTIRLPYSNMKTILIDTGMEPVPFVGSMYLPDTVDEILEAANGKTVIDENYPPRMREGIVVRRRDRPMYSFKVVSNEYLLSLEKKNQQEKQEAPKETLNIPE